MRAWPGCLPGMLFAAQRRTASTLFSIDLPAGQLQFVEVAMDAGQAAPRRRLELRNMAGDAESRVMAAALAT